MKYRDWYNSEILNKIKKFGYDCEKNKRHYVIDCDDPHDIDDPYDIDGTYVAIPTPEEFFNWVLNNYKFYISIIPEDDYKHGVVFRYNIYERDYDDHFNLKLTKSDFRTHNEAVENAVYDLLVNFEK